jgi:hypothetical protein
MLGHDVQERLFRRYFEASRRAQTTRHFRDGVAAGKAWAAFLASFTCCPCCIEPQERTAQLRYLQGVAAVYLGATDPLVATLRRPETDSTPVAHAAELLGHLSDDSSQSAPSAMTGSITTGARQHDCK